MHKIAFVSGFAILLLATVLINLARPTPTPQWVIAKVAAAYENMSHNPGILYRKTLYEYSTSAKPGIASEIMEDWDDQKGSTLFFKRDANTEQLLMGQMKNRYDPRGPYFSYEFGSDKFLPIMGQAIPNKDLEFLLTQLYGSKGISFISNQVYDIMASTNHTLAQTPPREVFYNFTLSPGQQLPDQNPPQPQKPKLLFTILPDNKTAVDAEGKILTEEDFPQLESQLRADLKKYKNLEYVINQKQNKNNAFHCLAQYQDEHRQFAVVLSVWPDFSAYDLIGSGKERDPSLPANQGALGLLNHNIDALASQKLSADQIQSILDQLKNFENVEYEERTENGKKYYVFTLSMEGDLNRYAFNADTYQLHSVELEGYRKRYDHADPPKVLSTDYVKHKVTFLETKFLDQSEGQNIFDPDRYGMQSDARLATLWEPLPSMGDGCYDAKDQLLSPAETEKIFNALPKEAVQRFEEQKAATALPGQG